MYEYLEGRLVSRGATRVVIDVGGLAYDVAIPLGSDLPRVADGDGERIRVWTHFVVREDAHKLFGFATSDMREIFRLLLQVRGVGPGMALAILSSMPADDLLGAIAAQDPGPLTRIKGVGKKTAEQILLDLRDRAPTTATDLIVPQPPAQAGASADAVAALISIGYSDKQARRSVEKAAAKVDSGDLELLVRTALRE